MNDCIFHKRVSLNSSPAPYMPSKRWTQPLAIAIGSFDFVKHSLVFATLAPASGGSVLSR
jgi:hypothetical protein